MMMVLLSACFLTSWLLSFGAFKGLFCDVEGPSVHATEAGLQKCTNQHRQWSRNITRLPLSKKRFPMRLVPQRYLPACVGELILKSLWQDRLWSVCSSVARYVYRSTGRPSKGALLLTQSLPTCARGTCSVTCDRQQARPRSQRKSRDSSEPSGPQELAAQSTARHLMAVQRLPPEACWYVASATLIRLGLTRQSNS